MKKKIIQIVIFIISLLVAFIIGKFSSKRDNDKLKTELNNAINKLTEIEKKNEILIKLTEEQNNLIDYLYDENQNSKNCINSIKEINLSTEEKLNNLNSSNESISSSLNEIKEINRILKEYFNSISSVMEE